MDVEAEPVHVSAVSGLRRAQVRGILFSQISESDTMSRMTRALAVRFKIALTCCIGIVCSACSKTLITSRAPNQSATVRVKEWYGFPDCVVTVTVQKGWWTEKEIANHGDCIINFAHVAWTPDSRFAAIFVANSYCSSIQQVYDLRTASLVPFKPLADLVRRSIIREYGIRPSELARYRGDSLEWAHYPGDGIPSPGVEAFREKHKP